MFVWSRKQPLASSGAVLGLLDGPHGCDLSFCLVWFRFLLFRRYLSFRPEERSPGKTDFLTLCMMAALVTVHIHALVVSARRIRFSVVLCYD